MKWLMNDLVLEHFLHLENDNPNSILCVSWIRHTTAKAYNQNGAVTTRTFLPGNPGSVSLLEFQEFALPEQSQWDSSVEICEY